ncbi:GerAB/ArcD/ProY family transporter [Ectobacillus ponti]|uniref:Spore germination protein n=1 Tax=Ectobacillus ponti TaxID=2961894 RepID=A0AA42BPL3_9BACI|nr:GerAB/ArcD/ProY family transporter [Ectobacillus ponti]MCP8969250.1 spore germination protein [Ectobacillus ponti]
MKIRTAKLQTREFLALVSFAIGIRFTDTTPNLLIDLGKNAAWMMPFIMGGCMLVSLLLLLSLIQRHQLGLMELVMKLAGKKAGFVIGFLLFCIMLSSDILNMRSYVDIIDTMFYQETPTDLLLLFLAAAAWFVANRGFAVIGQTSWIVFPYIIGSAILIILLSWKETNVLQIFPLEGPGLPVVLKGGITHSSVFGEIILLALFFPFVRSYRQFRLAALGGFAISCSVVAVYCALYVISFDYPAVSYLAFPFQQLTRAVPLGEMITHAEAIFLGFWIIASVLHFAIALYITAFLFAKMVQIHEFEPLLLPIAGFVVIAGRLPTNIMASIALRTSLIYVGSVVLVLLPFVLWLLDFVKRRLQT